MDATDCLCSGMASQKCEGVHNSSMWMTCRKSTRDHFSSVDPVQLTLSPRGSIPTHPSQSQSRSQRASVHLDENKPHLAERTGLARLPMPARRRGSDQAARQVQPRLPPLTAPAAVANSGKCPFPPACKRACRFSLKKRL